MKKHLTHNFEDIIGVDHLLCAWLEFLKDKRSRQDVQLFQFYLMDKVLALHDNLVNKTYRHGKYSTFRVSDPKPRIIHTAPVRDRLLHHALYRKLYPFFDKTFIAGSYSCRKDKGTHRALDRFDQLARKVSQNHTHTVWVLKCDIKQFFASVDHEVLLRMLSEYIPEKGILQLCEEIIGSFYSTRPGVGLPLGNLTSQLFVNIYMNEFDQFVKHKLKAKPYIRYADDFLLLNSDWPVQKWQLWLMRDFLKDKLKLELHPDKCFIKTIASGVDFLGWVHFPDHRVLRTSTKRRMLKKINEENRSSYEGMLGWGNTHKILADLQVRGFFLCDVI